MKNICLFVLAAIVSFSAFGQENKIKSAGTMSEMGKTGFAPTLSMDTLQQYPRIFGMGPLGKMQAEICTIKSN